MENSSSPQKPRFRRSERKKAEELFREVINLNNQLGELVGARLIRSSLGFGESSRQATADDIQRALQDPDLAPQVQVLLQKLPEVWRLYLEIREQALIGLRTNNPTNLAHAFFAYGFLLDDDPVIQEELRQLYSRQHTTPRARECLREVHRGMEGIGSGGSRRKTKEDLQQANQERQQRFREQTARGKQLIKRIIKEQYDSLPKTTRDYRAAWEDIRKHVLDVALNFEFSPIKRAAKQIQKSTKPVT